MAACCEPRRPRSASPPAADAAQPAAVTGSAGRRFIGAEDLRALLVRLDDAGPGAWESDPAAADLMRFCADRYARLARKYRQDPTDAAAAAFEAMLSASTRTADDPWAVVTVAVRITLIAQHRADGLLTSTNRARRAHYSAFHDADRFSTTALAEYHPALQSIDDQPNDDAYQQLWVVDQAARVLVALGWPTHSSVALVGHITGRLADLGDRHTAYETLRRDKALRAHFDVSHDSWIRLLRLCLGHHTTTGRLRHGLLARLLVGDPIADLLSHPDVTAAALPASHTLTGECVG